MYLMLYHKMKATQFGVIYKKLPTLETLERMTFTAVTIAFLVLSLAILFGFIWLYRAIDNPNYFDPKLIGTGIIWVMYGFFIVARTQYKWKGRKGMILSIIGFLISLFSMTIINIFFSGFHKFY
jgi:ABC-type transport system involved in cytochrome c biogenesis permease subunit